MARDDAAFDSNKQPAIVFAHNVGPRRTPPLRAPASWRGVWSNPSGRRRSAGAVLRSKGDL